MNKIEILDEQGPSGEVIVKIGPLSSEELIFGLNKPIVLDEKPITFCDHVYKNGLSALSSVSPSVGERFGCLLVCDICGTIIIGN